jgi:hypothetical protein
MLRDYVLIVYPVRSMNNRSNEYYLHLQGFLKILPVFLVAIFWYMTTYSLQLHPMMGTLMLETTYQTIR